MMISHNDKLILSVYKQGQGLTAEVKSGFATVKQRQAIVGLELLEEAWLTNGQHLPKGTTVYFDETELLSPHSGARFPKKADFSEQEFIIMDFKQALGINLTK